MSQKNRYFQYLAGERIGEVLVFDRIEQDEDAVFVCFKDNSRCNEDLILEINQKEWNGMLMAEIESPDNAWTFDEKWVGRKEEKWCAPEDTPDGKSVCIQPAVKGKKKVTPLPPRKTRSNFGAVTNHIESANVTTANSPNVAEAAPGEPGHTLQNDPVWLMMEKSKKFETEVEMSLVISLPSKKLFDVAAESFEDGGEKTIEYIIHNLDDQEIKASIKNALQSAYKIVTEDILLDAISSSEPVAIEEPIISGPVEQKETEENEVEEQ